MHGQRLFKTPSAAYEDADRDGFLPVCQGGGEWGVFRAPKMVSFFFFEEKKKTKTKNKNKKKKERLCTKTGL